MDRKATGLQGGLKRWAGKTDEEKSAWGRSAAEARWRPARDAKLEEAFARIRAAMDAIAVSTFTERAYETLRSVLLGGGAGD